MSDAPANLFAVEPGLIAHISTLKAEMPALLVGSAITLMGETNVSKYLPGIFVRPLASGDAEDVGGDIQQPQPWEVIVAVKAIKDTEKLATNYQGLGALAHRVISLLHNATIAGVLFTYTGYDDAYESPTGHVQLALNFWGIAHIELSDNDTLADFLRFFPQYDAAAGDADDPRDHINLPAAREATP